DLAEGTEMRQARGTVGGLENHFVLWLFLKARDDLTSFFERPSGGLLRHFPQILRERSSVGHCDLSVFPHSIEADGEIAQVEIGISSFLPQLEKRVIERAAKRFVAAFHGDPDALAEIAALGEWAAAKDAAVSGTRAVQPEGDR